MGDITCPTCGEPWESYYLQHDLIWEVVDEPLARLWKTLQSAGKRPLNDPEFGPQFKEALEADGWKLCGDSLLSFVTCSCCPEGAKPDKEKEAVRQELAYLLGDDEDGLQSMIEDFDI